MIFIIITPNSFSESNRQFIKIHFDNCNPADLHFMGYNMLSEDPMVFVMDCKVKISLHFFFQVLIVLRNIMIASNYFANPVFHH